MSATIHYEAGFAAGGGPGVELPKVDPVILTDETAAVMALAYSWELSAWVIVDSQGSVYAQAENPAELADWLMDYAAELGDMHERGELA